MHGLKLFCKENGCRNNPFLFITYPFNFYRLTRIQSQKPLYYHEKSQAVFVSVSARERSTLHRAEKAPRRLTDAGESVTIKAQKEVLPIDGQPRLRLLQKSNRDFGRGRLLFCVIYVSNQD